MINELDLLKNFIIKNEDFERLKARLSSFNPFKVLRLENHEIRHSNVLAWLFNPKENHNIGDTFLRKFVLQTISKADNEDVLDDNIHLWDIQQNNYNEIEVLRENNNIDIFIVSHENKLAIIIENKIYSGEHSNQLERYLNQVKSDFPEYLILPIFLTLDGSKPENAPYCSASYEEILKNLHLILELYHDKITEDVFKFLHFYINIVEEIVMTDEKTEKLCRSIYKENEKAINLIYTIGNKIDIEKSIDNFLKTYNNIEKIWSNYKSFWFILPEFKKAKKMDSNWVTNYPTAYWFSEYYKKLKIVLEIGPFDVDDQRIKFIEYLEENGIHIPTRAKEPGRQYTRIYTNTQSIKDWTDSQEITDVMIGLFSNKKLKDVEMKLIKSIDNFTWS